MRRISLVMLVIVLLAACAGKPQREVAVPKTPVVTSPAPVLTPEQEQSYRQAVDWLAAGKQDLAKQRFESLLETQPRLAGAYVNLALIALQNDQASKLSELLERALSLNPKNVDALLLKANVAQAAGDFTEAEQLLLQAANVAPDHPQVQYNLGVLYELYLQEFDRAKKHYERYVATSDQQDTAMVERWIKLLERK
ncbi:MAG: tetratricopeptide repeat protein [Oleiphilaceae bacterium]|nr:tetratricopeptide repeat protein [Oleiphilaceae bacterium]